MIKTKTMSVDTQYSWYFPCTDSTTVVGRFFCRADAPVDEIDMVIFERLIDAYQELVFLRYNNRIYTKLTVSVLLVVLPQL